MAQVTCNPVTYWIGSTTERFTISNSLINETSNLTIDPNSGSGPGTILLDFAWINNNFSIVNKLTFRGAKHHSVDTIAGDAHVLVVIPEELILTGVGETVLGVLAGMTEGLHYDIFQITNAGNTYDVYYFRDLTNFELPKRQFQFDIEIA